MAKARGNAHPDSHVRRMAVVTSLAGERRAKRKIPLRAGLGCANRRPPPLQNGPDGNMTPLAPSARLVDELACPSRACAWSCAGKPEIHSLTFRSMLTTEPVCQGRSGPRRAVSEFRAEAIPACTASHTRLRASTCRPSPAARGLRVRAPPPHTRRGARSREADLETPSAETL